MAAHLPLRMLHSGLVPSRLELSQDLRLKGAITKLADGGGVGLLLYDGILLADRLLAQV